MKSLGPGDRCTMHKPLNEHPLAPRQAALRPPLSKATLVGHNLSATDIICPSIQVGLPKTGPEAKMQQKTINPPRQRLKRMLSDFARAHPANQQVLRNPLIRNRLKAYRASIPAERKTSLLSRKSRFRRRQHFFAKKVH